MALDRHDALLIVNVQNDFCPGGLLPVPRGDEVVPELNRWIDAVARAGGVVAASRCWHPADHISFETRGGPWPPHCIRNTSGAAFHPDLKLPSGAWIVTKGDERDRDDYSAFAHTGLARHLREVGIQRIWVGGLAQDVCVRASVLDGLLQGFEVHLIERATRAVDPKKAPACEQEMREAGARVEMAAA